MILLLQDPFGDTRIEQLLLRHIAKLPRIDGICYPEAVHPADVIAGDNCCRPAEPKHLRAIDNLGLPNTFEQNLQPRRHDRKHVHYPSPGFLTRTGPCACSRATGMQLVSAWGDPRLRAGNCLLKIFGEASATVEPSKCAFNHPAFSLSLEGTDTLRSCNDLNRPLAELCDRVEQLVAAVHTVSKDVTQLGKDEADIFQQRHRGVIVLDIGRAHLHGKHRAGRICDNVTFASLPPLARIKPAWTATFCGFHTLAVDDPSRRSALASLRPARAFDKHTIDPPPNVAVAPIIKVMLNRRERWKVLRQSAPLAAG